MNNNNNNNNNDNNLFSPDFRVIHFFTAFAMPFCFTLFVLGRWITVKRACLPWQSVTLLMIFTKISTYVQDSGFKKTSKDSNTDSSFHMVELSSAIYSLRIYLRMLPKLTKEHTITVKRCPRILILTALVIF